MSFRPHIIGILLWAFLAPIGCAGSETVPPRSLCDEPHAMFEWSDHSEFMGRILERSVRVSVDGVATVVQTGRMKDGKPWDLDGLWNGQRTLDGSQKAELQAVFLIADVLNLELKWPRGPMGVCGLSMFSTTTIGYFPNSASGRRLTRDWVDNILVAPELPLDIQERFKAVDHFFVRLLAVR